MKIQDLFVRSNQELRRVVDQISAEQWSIDMPAGMTSKPATLGESVRYHAYDDAWVPDVLAGKTTAEVGDRYEELLATDFGDAIANYDKFNQLAIDSVKDFEDLERVTHLSYGDFPAKEYLQHIISFRAFRAYDIAKLIGVGPTLPDDLVQKLLEEFSPVIEGYRQMGIFPAALEVPSDATPHQKLMAMVGRE